MNTTPNYQETLRRLAIVDDHFVTAGLMLDETLMPALDAKTAALLQVSASAASGSTPACLEWSTARALAAGASKDEIVDVLVAIAPIAGLSRIASVAPMLGAALDYDVETALAEYDED